MRWDGQPRFLVREERLDLQSVVEGHVDGQPHGRRAIQVDALIGHELEEVTTEPVAGERADLDCLRTRRSGRAQGPGQHQEDETGRPWPHDVKYEV